MIKFEYEGVAGFVPAIRGMRNPKNSWDKSDSIDCTKYINCQGCQLDGTDCHSQGWFMLGENDRQLALILANAGTDHGKFLRMINVCIDITAPFYWWKEFDTYRMGVEKQYEEAKTDKAKYMLQRRLIRLKHDLNEYYRLQKQVDKYVK